MEIQKFYLEGNNTIAELSVNWFNFHKNMRRNAQLFYLHVLLQFSKNKHNLYVHEV